MTIRQLITRFQITWLLVINICHQRALNNEGLQFENKNNVCMTAIYDILITFDAFFYILMCFILMSEILNNRDNVRVSFIFKIRFLYYFMQVVSYANNCMIQIDTTSLPFKTVYYSNKIENCISKIIST